MLKQLDPVYATRQAHLAAVIAQYERQPPNLADALEYAQETYSALCQLARFHCPAHGETRETAQSEAVA